MNLTSFVTRRRVHLLFDYDADEPIDMSLSIECAEGLAASLPNMIDRAKSPNPEPPPLELMAPVLRSASCVWRTVANIEGQPIGRWIGSEALIDTTAKTYERATREAFELVFGD